MPDKRDTPERRAGASLAPSPAGERGPALALYRKAGFNEVGVRRGYYPAANGREDALILALHLGPDGWYPFTEDAEGREP